MTEEVHGIEGGENAWDSARDLSGDTLNVTGQQPIILTQTQIDAGTLTFEYERPADGEVITVTATLTDQAGNQSPEGSDAAVMGDTTATAAPVDVGMMLTAAARARRLSLWIMSKMRWSLV